MVNVPKRPAAASKRAVRRSAVLPLLAIFALTAWAQYPAPSDPPKDGQPTGYPPNGYPPGTVPQRPIEGGESKIPTASRNKKKQKKKEKDQLPVISAEGKTLFNDGKKLVVKVDDGRTLTMAVDEDTKWTRSGADIEVSKVAPRTTVRVDAAEEDNFDLTVRHVDLLKDPPVESPAVAASRASATQQPENNDDDVLTRPTILHGPDVPDRPVLHHGKPAGSNQAADSHTVEVSNKASGDMDFTIDNDSKAPPKHSFSSELLNTTMDWTSNFMEGLPNYVCQQDTTRYMQRSRSEDWQAQDVVSARVVYEDGHDSYRNIMVNGKKTTKDMMEIGGQTSTGEFGGVLISLFQPVRNTDFTYARATSLGDAQVAIYDFKVALGSSDWQIIVGGQVLAPAYSGRIWVDKKTGEIRRLEQRADNIPKDFPNDTVEMAIDYEEVSLGTPTKYLVPTHSENISCQRGTQYCGKNVIEFRDYHRYAGESTIIFH
jgi:hypothetical protein